MTFMWKKKNIKGPTGIDWKTECNYACERLVTNTL